MSISRYDLRTQALVANDIYREMLEARGVRWIKLYRTARLKYPSPAELRNIETITHIWKMGDRYEKMAFQFYGDAKLWWVIAWFNKRPGEFTNRIGDVLHVPISLEKALSVLGV